MASADEVYFSKQGIICVAAAIAVRVEYLCYCCVEDRREQSFWRRGSIELLTPLNLLAWDQGVNLPNMLLLMHGGDDNLSLSCI